MSSSLYSILGSVSQSLEAFQNAMDVTQNNVTNANTTGYADQNPEMVSLAFQPGTGLAGGVEEVTQDTRSSYADSAVQEQMSLQGMYQQLQTSLGPLQNVFDVSSTSAIPSALNGLFQSFSEWATQPNNASYQASVLDAAQQVATSFQQAAQQLGSIQTNTTNDIQSTVTQINQDAATIQSYNEAVAQNSTPDPGLSAQLESTLENLSGLANISTIKGIGNQVTVFLGGQTLVIGNQVNDLQAVNNTASNAGNPGAAPNISIVDSNGDDITGQVTSGSLAGLLSVRNTMLPSLIGGGQQVGGLNTLAQGLADSINKVLEQASTTATPPYQNGVALFTYNDAAPAGIAGTLAVSSTITGSQLAAADTGGSSVVANGAALTLSNLDSTTPGPVDGQGFTQYFSSLASSVGYAVSNATTAATAQTSLVAQAQSLQQQVSGVSLDAEAVQLVQLQGSYQAASKVVTVIDSTLQSLMNMLPG